MKSRLTIALLAAGIVCLANQILAADSETNEVLILTAKGEEAFEQKKFDQAVDCYTKVLQLDPNNANALYVRSWAHQWMGAYDYAIIDLNKCIPLSTNNYSLSYALMSRGDAYYQKINYEVAINDFTKAIQLNPKLTDAYLARARTFYAIKQFDRSIIDCSMAVWLKPDLSEAFCLRGMANKHNGDFNKALVDLDKAIQLDKTNGMFYFQRAGVMESKGNYSDAIADCDRTIEYNPRNADAFSARGLFYSKTGEFIKGIEDCKKGVLLDTNNFGANNNLAWLLAIAPDAKLRDGPKSLEYAKRACELSEWKNAYCLGTLAAAYAETGNYEEAVKWEKKCISTGLPEREMQQAQNELELFKQKKPYHAEK